MPEDKEKKEGVTRMVAPTGRKVKIEAIRTLQFESDDGEVRLAPGQTAEVPEEVAQQLCAPVQGPYDFSGERATRDATRHTFARAKKVV